MATSAFDLLAVATRHTAAHTPAVASMFTFVGITLALLLMIACWLEARDRQRNSDEQPGRYEPTLNVRREDLSGTS